ncbi:hydrogenase [Kosakonia radicincitans]|uniref:dimethyl sulfoxide reductase anchor subunit family protein n=1 Tax=Kosakonia TaxID=1330547 RepID=UPI0009A71930|nr:MULTISPECIES: DmsC/YnfH family molybdoenzyme membrane anchor subunit [Kosakonia]MDD7997050.1 dimethyl sulfoxide reductase anchor subunit [Kosakonia radicincitans]NCF03725.1 hydrogenase [Kosakonia sp. MH5]QEM91846.1 hydrogenase [Kosakonia radicincitans]SKC22224.1 DMSO reductase anchor subunit [Kosakonia radicincitans]VVT49730.1 Anaerobic dimethyl sulfoxide reductase chain C (EC, anchor subunit [Kosakonia radicincitans]
MEHYELPLVFFTSLSQTSVGMALFLAWRRIYNRDIPQRRSWFITGVVLGISLIGATFHLADPFHGYNAFINLRHSWLSREILAASLFAVTIALALFTDGKVVTVIAAAVMGIILIAVQGLTYAAPAMIAINNGLPMILYLLTAWVMGAAMLPLLDKSPALSPLRQGLVLLILAMVIAPVIWRSGGTIARMTAEQWSSSPFFWSGLICFALTLVLSCQRQKASVSIATVIIALSGIILSRLTFFGDTVSTIINIGQPY